MYQYQNIENKIISSSKRTVKTLNDRQIVLNLKFVLWFLAINVSTLVLLKTQWGFKFNYIGVPFLIVGIFLLVLSGKKVFVYKHNYFSDYTIFVYGMLFCWGLVTIVRGLDLNFITWRNAFGGIYFAGVWLIPLGMLLGGRHNVWPILLNVITQQAKVGVTILIVASIFLHLYSDLNFVWGCPYALLFWHYLPKRWRKYVLIGAIIALLFAIRSATRNMVFGIGLLMLFAAYIQFFRNTKSRMHTRVIIVGLFTGVFLLVNYVSNTDHVPLVGSYVNERIAEFKEKSMVNTRVSGSHNLYSAFLDDVTGIDFVIGRGCMGEYYFSGVGGYRSVIECGYFFVILKGGIIMLILMLALALPAIYQGLMHSNNWFTRGSALVIIGRLLEMFPFGVPATTPSYLLFWMAIGCCLSSQLRALPDSCFMIADLKRTTKFRW